METFETEYTVTPGRTVKIATWAIFILFISIAVIVPFLIYILGGAFFEIMIFVILDVGIFTAVFIGAWAYSPTKYSTTESEVKIFRPINTISIPMKEIKKVEDKEISMFKTIKLWANSGVLSMSGQFYNKSDGKFWMYTKNDRYVMIHAKERWVVSPDDKEVFINDVKGKLEKRRKLG